MTAVYLIFIFALAIFLGFELISKVPSTLHTPLMSASNAISGITLIGALASMQTSHHGFLPLSLARLRLFWPPSTWSAAMR